MRVQQFIVSVPSHAARRGCRAATVAAVLFAVCAGGGASADPLGDIIKVRAEGNAVTVKSQARIDKISEQTDKLVTDYRGVLQQVDALRVYNRQLDKLITSQEEEIGSLRGQIDNVTVVGRQITPLMLRMIDSLEQFVGLDMPFLPDERSERVVQLREMMDRADVEDSEKFRRLLEAYQVENEYGRTIEAYRGSLEFEGESRTVDFLRMGRIALIYQTLDGADSGVWDTSTGGWVRLGSEFRNPIRQGLRIARKQAAPDLIRLPIQAAGAER